MFTINNILSRIRTIFKENLFSKKDRINFSIKLNKKRFNESFYLIRILYGYKFYKVLCIVEKLYLFNYIYNKNFIKIIKFSHFLFKTFKKFIREYDYICFDKFSGSNIDFLIKKYLIKIGKFIHFLHEDYLKYYLFVNNIIKGRIRLIKINNKNIFNICLGKIFIGIDKIILNILGTLNFIDNNIIKLYNIKFVSFINIGPYKVFNL